ncbi:LysE family translocator [Lysinibacillus sp. 3P01SB]|uniref:LysE family translocator n=1 Tax=Lysinibacillus sp. 3P01SB TaxID=3132284 RepID=UPI0039A4164E
MIKNAIHSYLTAKTWFQNKGLEGEQVSKSSPKKDYWQGVLTNVANPKNILFSLSFLPPFFSENNDRSALPSSILGAIFSLVDSIWYISRPYFTSSATKSSNNGKLFLYAMI